MFRRLCATSAASVSGGLMMRRTVVHDFTGPTIKDELAKGSPLVLDCYADWCGPCKAYASRFDAHSEANPNIRFVKLNVDNFEDVAAELSIRSVPTFHFFDKAGSIQATVEGANDARITESLKKLSGN